MSEKSSCGATPCEYRFSARLIGFSSTTLALNAPGYSIYNATKGAVEGMVRVIAKELGSRGITVNAIAPGPVETELFLRGKSQADIDRMVAMAPQKRLGQPSEIANLRSDEHTSEPQSLMRI